MTDAAKLIELEAGQEYTIQTANRMEKIPYKDIFYIQRDGKKCQHRVQRRNLPRCERACSRYLKNWTRRNLSLSTAGCIVNILQIMKISGSTAILKNGEPLPISRSHLQEVKQTINQFWGAHI